MSDDKARSRKFCRAHISDAHRRSKNVCSRPTSAQPIHPRNANVRAYFACMKATPEKLEALRRNLTLAGLRMDGGDKPTPKVMQSHGTGRRSPRCRHAANPVCFVPCSRRCIHPTIKGILASPTRCRPFHLADSPLSRFIGTPHDQKRFCTANATLRWWVNCLLEDARKSTGQRR